MKIDDRSEGQGAVAGGAAVASGVASGAAVGAGVAGAPGPGRGGSGGASVVGTGVTIGPRLCSRGGGFSPTKNVSSGVLQAGNANVVVGAASEGGRKTPKI